MALSRLVSKKTEVGGELGYFGLGSWWLSAFTESERDYIEKVFQPLGIGWGDNSRSLTQGVIDFHGGTAVNLLSGLAGWFKKPEDLSIARRILDKAEEIGRREDVIDKHYLYQCMIEVYYRARDIDLEFFDKAIAACQKQIDIAPQVARAFKKEVPAKEAERIFGARLPEHVGYKQLAIIREKQKDYREAIRLSKEAKKRGWNGDWDKRIARCETRLHKQEKIDDR